MVQSDGAARGAGARVHAAEMVLQPKTFSLARTEVLLQAWKPPVPRAEKHLQPQKSLVPRAEKHLHRWQLRVPTAEVPTTTVASACPAVSRSPNIDCKRISRVAIRSSSRCYRMSRRQNRLERPLRLHILLSEEPPAAAAAAYPAVVGVALLP